MDIRPKLDEAQLNDLRKNHFNIGGPSAAITNTSNFYALRPGTAIERNEMRSLISFATKSWKVWS